MTAQLKKLLIVTPLTLLLSLVLVSPARAAAPDGIGPWADNVMSSSQALRKDGSAVPASRSDVNSTLGVAENNTTEGNFYSLGFGGSISLGFDNGISSGVIIVEATNLPYPTETAKIEVSENGTTWVTAGNVSADGQVNKPESVSCAKYVRITDTSNKDNFSDSSADGYDVDGVQASGEPCTPPTPPTCGTTGCCTSNITQTNTANIVNNVSVGASTGGNNANKNTGGAVDVASGNATANVGITNTTGSNVATSPECCPTGTTTAIIKDNGAGSKNTIKINAKAKEKVNAKAKKK